MIVLHPEQNALFAGNTHARCKIISPGVWAIRPTNRPDTPRGEYRLAVQNEMLVGRHPIPAGITHFSLQKGWLVTGNEGLPAMVGGGEERTQLEEASDPKPAKSATPPASTGPRVPKTHMVQQQATTWVTEHIKKKMLDPIITMADVNPGNVEPDGMPNFLVRLTPERAAQIKKEMAEKDALTI